MYSVYMNIATEHCSNIVILQLDICSYAMHFNFSGISAVLLYHCSVIQSLYLDVV